MDELERILELEERIEPSSGLTDSVMRAVLEEAVAPPPLPFPWMRMVLGMGACVGLIVVGVVVAAVRGLPDPPPVDPSVAAFDSALAVSVGLPLITLLLTWFASRWSLRAMR